MDSSLPLATDSFSKSWLSSDHFKPPPDVNFLEENLISSSQSMNFDFSVSHFSSPSQGFAHADELFSDGFIRPLCGCDSSNMESCNNNTPHSTQTRSSSLFYSGIVSPRSVETHNHHHGFLSKWRKSTQKILRRSFGYLKQLCRRSIRVGDLEKTELEVKSWSISQQASPISSVKSSSMSDLFNHENSIHEAVLHCKRSIGMIYK